MVMRSALSATSGANIRMPSPLSPQLTKSFTGLMPWLITCKDPPERFSTVAPRPRITRIAALSSLETPGFLIMVSPAEINAAAQALCMELFEAGAGMAPCMEEGETVTCIVFIWLSKWNK
jgi:hypothetical protein